MKKPSSPTHLPSIASVRSALAAEWRYLRRNFSRSEFEERGTDVRLQVLENGKWVLHSGPSDYDQDHRGYWGASCLSYDRQNLTDLARDLIDQAADQLAEREAFEKSELRNLIDPSHEVQRTDPQRLPNMTFICTIVLRNAVRTTSKVVPVLVAAQDAKTASDRAGHLALRTVWEQPGWAVHSSKISLTEFNAAQIRALLGSVIVEAPCL